MRANTVEVAIPIGCMVPLAIAAAVLVGAGVLLGMQARSSIAPDHVNVRVIAEGAEGGPKVVFEAGCIAALIGPARAIDVGPMNVREKLHSLIDDLDARDAKPRLHGLVAQMDEETLHKIMAHVEQIRRRRSENWGFLMG